MNCFSVARSPRGERQQGETTTGDDTRHSHVKSIQLGAMNYVAKCTCVDTSIFACPQPSRAKTSRIATCRQCTLSTAYDAHAGSRASPRILQYAQRPIAADPPKQKSCVSCTDRAILMSTPSPLQGGRAV